MLERRRRRAAPQRLIRLRSLFECILERVSASARTSAETPPGKIGIENDTRARFACVTSSAAQIRSTRRSARSVKPLETATHSTASDGRASVSSSHPRRDCTARPHSQRVVPRQRDTTSAPHRRDSRARSGRHYDAVERGRWAWRLRHFGCASPGATAGVSVPRAPGRLRRVLPSRRRLRSGTQATSSDEQMVWFSSCTISFAFQAACATAAACAVAGRVATNRGATNSQMSQPSPITSMPPMTAWTPDAYSAYTLYAMPTTLIAIVRV